MASNGSHPAFLKMHYLYDHFSLARRCTQAKRKITRKIRYTVDVGSICGRCAVDMLSVCCRPLAWMRRPNVNLSWCDAVAEPVSENICAGWADRIRKRAPEFQKSSAFDRAAAPRSRVACYCSKRNVFVATPPQHFKQQGFDYKWFQSVRRTLRTRSRYCCRT